MALPPSGRRGRDSPSTAADLLSKLDVDDLEDDTSSFTLLAAPSTVSSLGPSMTTRRATAAAAAAAQGASPLALSATPVRTGGGGGIRASRSRRTEYSGGVGDASPVPSPKQVPAVSRPTRGKRSQRRLSSVSSSTTTRRSPYVLGGLGRLIDFASRQKTPHTLTVGLLRMGGARKEARNSFLLRERTTCRGSPPQVVVPQH